MSKQVEYRRYAALLLDIATGTATAADKLRLVAMAQAWVRLADKLARTSKWHRIAGTAAQQPAQAEPTQDQLGAE
jgi:hypothetical protein